ncbi:hypothetical protein [uncultured Campylobacter sp.]|nr:hypothetical protein [uncultured Campylobacter sp.]
MQLRLNRVVLQGITALLSPYTVRFCGSSLCAVIARASSSGRLDREL